jgi:ornithine cyclodeaminase/alanine dehydrogenase-like protein (mu-crystallin family)
MSTRVLDHHDTRALVRAVGIDTLMDQLTGRLTDTLASYDRERWNIPVREGFAYESPRPGLVEWMPIHDRAGDVTLKIVSYHPCNPSDHALPTILSTVGAYCTRTGRLRGLVDGTFLTALRTGAASAIATRILAHGTASRLGMIGCGAQSVTQIHGVSRVIELDEIAYFDIEPAVMATFPDRVRRLGLGKVQFRPATASEVARTADVLCTATTVGVGAGPVFPDEDLRPWIHVNAVGADFPGKTEVPRSLLDRAFVCPDFLLQAIREGECQVLDASSIGPELHEIVRAPDAFADRRGVPTVFDSTGWALEDHVALEYLFDLAEDMGLGTPIELEWRGLDPRDPYCGVADLPTEATIRTAVDPCASMGKR